ncbi:MAG: hypothetical protein E7525_04730 [Ruminococcaceae bacterium]|nr:hypothetical protein [Oscillospiraceae bacterium]
MFFLQYKTSFKNLSRAPLFWAALAVVVFAAVYGALEGTYYDDNQPQFILDYETYIQQYINICVPKVMVYSMPFFTVVTTALLLSRDYGDGFYEIEKAGGVRPVSYFFGRMAALITVDFVVVTVACYLSFYLYYFTRGGVAELTVPQMLADSLIRMMRLIIFISMPCILMYIGLTYFTGSLFKRSYAGSVVGLGYLVITFAAISVLHIRARQTVFGKFYFDYLLPLPEKIRFYLHNYDTKWFEGTIKSYGVTAQEAIISVAILVTVAVVYFSLSYILVRRREI